MIDVIFFNGKLFWKCRIICNLFLGVGWLIEIVIKKWLSCVFGRGKVFCDLIGFCVVIIKNGFGRGVDCFFSVICCFFIVFNKFDCVFGIVWLILFVSKMFVIIGLIFNLNLFVFGLKYLIFVILFGSILGVNWMWEKLLLIFFEMVFVSNVFLVLGMFLSSICLLVRSEMSSRLIIFFLLINIDLMFFFNLFIICIIFFIIKELIFLYFNKLFRKLVWFFNLKKWMFNY